MASHYGAFDGKKFTSVDSSNISNLNSIITGKDGLNSDSWVNKLTGGSDNFVLARFNGHSEVIVGTGTIEYKGKTLSGYKLWDPGYQNDVFMDSRFSYLSDYVKDEFQV
jgi:hypothetical protein